MARLTLSITDSLRHQLEEARERSGRTLTAEVEGLLRVALDAKASERMIVLRVDEGLWAWLTAYVRGVGLAGDHEETVTYFVRQGLHTAIGGRGGGLRQAMLPYLPEPIRKALKSWAESG